MIPDRDRDIENEIRGAKVFLIIFSAFFGGIIALLIFILVSLTSCSTPKKCPAYGSRYETRK